MSNGDPIIVKGGGSVEIEFNEQTFPGQRGKYTSKERNIASLEVRDDNTGEIQTINLPANGKCMIIVNIR